MTAKWQCEQCDEMYPETREPAAKESYPGAELWFCEECVNT